MVTVGSSRIYKMVERVNTSVYRKRSETLTCSYTDKVCINLDGLNSSFLCPLGFI